MQLKRTVITANRIQAVCLSQVGQPISRTQPNSREKGANYAAVFGENVKLRGNYAED
jgi:hypothetical protein